jgi:metal-responsive CopG/Arc/MetJ family transcriptional regulator
MAHPPALFVRQLQTPNKMTSLVIREDVLQEVEMMAARAGRNRSDMIRQLLMIGLDEARRQFRQLEQDHREHA